MKTWTSRQINTRRRGSSPVKGRLKANRNWACDFKNLRRQRSDYLWHLVHTVARDVGRGFLYALNPERGRPRRGGGGMNGARAFAGSRRQRDRGVESTRARRVHPAGARLFGRRRCRCRPVQRVRMEEGRWGGLYGWCLRHALPVCGSLGRFGLLAFALFVLLLQTVHVGPKQVGVRLSKEGAARYYTVKETFKPFNPRMACSGLWDPVYYTLKTSHKG